MKLNLGSWKTTSGGVIAFACVVFVGLKIWNSYLTGQPIDTDTLISGVLGVASAINGLFARDRDVSSEDQGIK